MCMPAMPRSQSLGRFLTMWHQYVAVSEGKNSQALMDYYQNGAKYRQELEKLNRQRIFSDSIKLLEKKIRRCRNHIFPVPQEL